MFDLQKAKTEAKKVIALLELSNLEQAQITAEKVVSLIKNIRCKPAPPLAPYPPKELLSEESVIETIKNYSGIHISGIRNKLDTDDLKCWKTWNIVKKLEAEEKIRTEKQRNRVCCWLQR